MAKDTEKQQDLIEKARKNFTIASEAWDKQYKLSQKDMIFCSSEHQWPAEVRQARIGRPTYSSDRINAQIKSLVNAQRENRPAVRIHVCNDGADEDTAEVLQGMFRHIENSSDADLAYDQAFEDTVRCGLGFWRLLTKYVEDSFDQDISVESIINPFSVYLDPYYKKIDGSDINYCFIIDTMSEDEYKETYPDSDLSAMNTWIGLGQRIPEWFSNNGKVATVAEYFVREEEEKTIVKLSDGRVLAKEDLLDEDKPLILLERNKKQPIIHWYKINGIEILEESVWPGKYIPIIPVFGDALLEEGQRIYSGLVRKVMEEQMMLNVAKTTAIELIAATPKTPWIGPVGFVGDRKSDWQDVNLKNLAYLEYEVMDDMNNPLPPPTRNIQEPPIQGVLELMNSIEMDIKSTNNMYDPSLGQKVSNQSGKAITALQNAGSTGNYHYSDNLSRAIRLEGRMFLDLVPKIYPEKRVMRIIGIDDKHKLITINGTGSEQETGIETVDGVAKIYDITTGKYDVSVSSGPSYQTKRAENLDMLFDLAGKDPALMNIAGDLIVSQLDSPIAIQLRERLEKALPPGLLSTPGDKDIPPELQARLQHDQQLIQQLTMALQKETELADKEQNTLKAKLQIAQLDAQTALMKAKLEAQHETNMLLFKEELADTKNKASMAHEAIINIQKHHLDIEKIHQKAAADTVQQTVGAALNPKPTPQTLQEPKPEAYIAPPK